MNPNKLFSSLNKVIVLLFILLTALIVAVMLYTYGGGLKNLITQTAKTTDAFQDYDVVKKFGGGVYNVEFRDLITSAGGMEKRYYRFDLTIQTEDKRSAESMIDVRKQVVAIINGVMGTFPPEDMNTEAERSRVKTIIQSEVSSYYPDIMVKDIYFTNFLYD